MFKIHVNMEIPIVAIARQDASDEKHQYLGVVMLNALGMSVH